MATLSSIRSSTDRTPICAYALFIEGIADIFVTDHPGDVLLGSGAGSWIREYEIDAAYTSHETSGQRVVRGGLKLPGSISRGSLNPTTGMLETSQVSFQLVDVDGILVDRFANEGKETLYLAERIAPGTSALGATLQVQPGGGTINPAGYNIGIERIGPARERRWFFPFPFAGIGPHHQNHDASSLDSFDGPPLTRVSVEPIDFAGRVVALYRLYRDWDGDGSYTAWPHWGDQYDAGGLVWWGVMQDRGQYQGDQTWSVQCWGPESWLRRQMCTNDTGWMPINAVSTALAADERGIAVTFEHRTPGGTVTVYDSSYFDTLAEADYSSSSTLAAAVNSFVQSYADGTNSDFGTGGDFNAALAYVQFTREQVQIQADANLGAQGDGTYSMRLCMHEETWRLLGWDLDAQVFSITDPLETLYAVAGLSLDAGDVYTWDVGSASVQTPADGYYTLNFTTRALGFSALGSDAPASQESNDGAWRLYWPSFNQGDPVVLSSSGGQTFSCTYNDPYIERDPLVEEDTYDAARFFLFRGKRSLVVGGEVVTEDEYQVGRVRWDYQGSAYGTVAVTDASPTFYLDRWLLPRGFQIDNDKFSGDWASLAGTEYQIECKPLHVYGYRTVANDNEAFERAWAVLGQLLLSTGTATGWSGVLFGSNIPPTAAGDYYWISDNEMSEKGLGIPHELVQDPVDMFNAFDLGNGVDQHAGLNQVRYVYEDSFHSQDLIESILRPRGLAMTLRNGLYSVQQIGLFEPSEADVTISDTSVHGSMTDSRTVIPSQQLRATGPLDRVDLEAGRDPSTGDYNVELSHATRDPAARFRRGDISEALHEDGLIPQRFRYQAGQGAQIGENWESDFRQKWVFDIPNWRAKRHFVVEVNLHRVSGQDVWPGTTVSFSNQWVFNPSGSLGVTGAIGVVLTADFVPGIGQEEGEYYPCRVLVFADQFEGLPLFSPIGKVADGYTGGASVPLVPDAGFLKHGGDEDGGKFVEPSWSAVGGTGSVCILEYDRSSWTLHSGDSQTVSAGSGTSVTLSGAFSTTFHARTDKYLVQLDYDSQASSSYTRSIYCPIVLDTLQFGSGPTNGTKLLDG